MYDSKNRIEFGVAILHGGFRYGVYLGKVVSAAIRTETTADFLFYLYLPHPSFTCVILIRYVKVCEEGKQIVLHFEDAFLETFKFIVKMCKALTQEVFHFGFEHLYLPFRDVTRSPKVDCMRYQMYKPS